MGVGSSADGGVVGELIPIDVCVLVGDSSGDADAVVGDSSGDDGWAIASLLDVAVEDLGCSGVAAPG